MPVASPPLTTPTATTVIAEITQPVAVDLAEFVTGHAERINAVHDDRLAALRYQPWERASVVLGEVLADTDVAWLGAPAGIDPDPFFDVDVDYAWTPAHGAWVTDALAALDAGTPLPSPAPRLTARVRLHATLRVDLTEFVPAHPDAIAAKSGYPEHERVRWAIHDTCPHPEVCADTIGIDALDDPDVDLSVAWTVHNSRLAAEIIDGVGLPAHPVSPDQGAFDLDI